MKQIAHIESVYKSKFGVPRQAGLVEVEARVVFEPEYRVAEAVRGLDEFDYIWLVWGFHQNKVDKLNVDKLDISTHQRINVSTQWSPTVRPPRLGGNKRVGVFATRSPYRPNPIGLSSVRLLRVAQEAGRGPVLYVGGADLVDGTPIYDIKPYIPYADSHPDARGGFAQQAPEMLRVEIADDLLQQLPEELRKPLGDSLALDPRPHYQDDPQRRYTMPFDRWEVRFRVENGVVKVEALVLNKVKTATKCH